MSVCFFDRKLLHELVTSLSHGVLLTHEKLVQEHKSNLTQNQALQILFDLRFMMSILTGRGENESSEFPDRLDQVTDTLESCVDPFDLDVFSPHISTNLNRQLQRCGVCVTINTSCGLTSCTGTQEAIQKTKQYTKAFHPTKNSRTFKTVANGTGIQRNFWSNDS